MPESSGVAAVEFATRPLIASFLHRAFIGPNERVIAQADLVEKLEDELFTLCCATWLPSGNAH